MHVDQSATECRRHSFLNNPIPLWGVLTQSQVFQVRDLQSVLQLRISIPKQQIDKAKVLLCQPSISLVHRLFSKPAKSAYFAMKDSTFILGNCDECLWKRLLQFADEITTIERHHNSCSSRWGSVNCGREALSHFDVGAVVHGPRNTVRHGIDQRRGGRVTIARFLHTAER